MQHKNWLIVIALLSRTATEELWVELTDTTGLPPEVRDTVEREVADIYSEAGVSIRWIAETPAEPLAHVARVYLMDKLPASLGARLRAFGGRPMALALGTEGNVSGPTIYVSRSATSGRVRDAKAVGRALGRVIAHELAHREPPRPN